MIDVGTGCPSVLPSMLLLGMALLGGLVTQGTRRWFTSWALAECVLRAGLFVGAHMVYTPRHIVLRLFSLPQKTNIITPTRSPLMRMVYKLSRQVAFAFMISVIPRLPHGFSRQSIVREAGRRTRGLHRCRMSPSKV